MIDRNKNFEYLCTGKIYYPDEFFAIALKHIFENVFYEKLSFKNSL